MWDTYNSNLALSMLTKLCCSLQSNIFKSHVKNIVKFNWTKLSLSLISFSVFNYKTAILSYIQRQTKLQYLLLDKLITQLSRIIPTSNKLKCNLFIEIQFQFRISSIRFYGQSYSIELILK